MDLGELVRVLGPRLGAAIGGSVGITYLLMVGISVNDNYKEQQELYMKTHPETGQLCFWPSEKPTVLRAFCESLNPQNWEWIRKEHEREVERALRIHEWRKEQGLKY